MPKLPSKSTLGPEASPQERFQANDLAMKAHRAMVDADTFDFSADAALVQMATELADGIVDMNSAAAAGYKLKGAVTFLRKFKTQAEVPKAPQADPVTGLIPTDRPNRA